MAKYTDTQKQQAKALRAQGKTYREISQALGGIPVGTVSSWFREQQQPHEAVVVSPPEDSETEDFLTGLRLDDAAPQMPSDGRLAPLELNYGSIADSIESCYKIGGKLVSKSDPLLGQVLDEHAAKAGEAWAAWIRSEPKVAAFLQRFALGTPLGEVIGVHVSMVVAYVFTRSAIREAAREADRRQTEQDVAADGPASGSVVVAAS